MTIQTGNEETAGGNSYLGRYLRLPEVLVLIGVSWRTLLRWEREGRFPKRYKIGPRIVAWRETEINQWFAEQENAPTSTSGVA